MATYEWIESSPDVEFLGPTTSKPIQRVTAQAVASGVVFHQSFDMSLLTPSNVATTLDRLARAFDAAAGNRNVTAISTREAINANNQLLDLVDVTLSSSSGKTQRDYSAGYAVIDLPPTGDGPGIFPEWVASRVAALDALEAG